MKIKRQSLAAWVLAARPRTLPAAVVPVLVGTALAISEGRGAILPAMLCLLFALLVQIATNFANDYFDAKKGADTPERLGPTRAVAAGLISAPAMWRATLTTLALALLVGCGLIPFGGWWLLAVGVASLICAVAYTGGPYPLGYHGWGDVFVVLFFGLIAVGVTYYVQAGGWSATAFHLGLGVGLMINNLLVVNNHRDAPLDAKVGKKTVVVRFGRPFGEALFASSYLIAASTVLGALAERLSLAAGLVVIAAAAGGGWHHYGLWKRLRKVKTPQEYGTLLKLTATEVVAYGTVLTMIILVSA